MKNKQTAVQWLIEEIGEYFPHEIGGIHFMIEKAKQMEKEQIIDAYNYGYLDYQILAHDNAEEYYEQKFGH